jgi:type I restriction enzyme, R subunit
MALLDKLIGKDYDVITADERLDKIAADFVEHRATRRGSGCFASIRSRPHAPAHHAAVAGEGGAGPGAFEAKQSEALATAARAVLLEEAANLEAQADWLDQTIIETIISERQNEVADFKEWGCRQAKGAENSARHLFWHRWQYVKPEPRN